MAGPVADGEPAEGGGEEPGGEGVAGTDGGDDVDVEGGDVGDGVGAVARGLSPPRPFPNRGSAPDPAPQTPEGLNVAAERLGMGADRLNSSPSGV